MAMTHPTFITSFLFLLRCLAVLFSLGAASLGADNPDSVPRLPSDTSPPIFLAVENGNGRGEASTARYDFGRITTLDTVPLEHTFVVRQIGQRPITLEKIRTSCPCTRAWIEGVVSLPTVLAPNQEFGVHVAVDPMQLPTGAISRAVFLFTRGQAAPAVQLVMQGTLDPAAIFSPAVTDFGRITNPQATVPMAVVVTLDPRLLRSGRPPRLVSSDPNVRVIPQDELVSPAQNRAAGREAGNRRTYWVLLSPNHPAGLLNETLSIVPELGNAFGRDGPSFGAAVIVGEIIGPLSASPEALILSGPTTSQETKRLIRVTCTAPALLKGLAVTCSSSFITAHVMAKTADALANTGSEGRTIEVVISPRTPVGTLKAKLRMEARGRVLLCVPVCITRYGVP